MKNLKFVGISTLFFLLLSLILFGGQYILEQQGSLNLSYRIHFLFFVITLICVVTLSIVFVFNKKDILGFVFLGFVIFKFFAIGYIAVFQPEFRLNLIPYFVIYWVYLLLEVIFVLRLVRKS